jgi:GMP synthase (glutamine-hydrolysing)
MAVSPSGQLNARSPVMARLTRCSTVVPDSFTAFVGHKEAVQSLPAGCVHLVASAPCPFQMIRHGENVYATQFHPELDSNGLEVRINIYKNRGLLTLIL